MITLAGVESRTGRSHQAAGGPNEDRTSTLDERTRLARELQRGFVYCVADGVGGAPKGMAAAQRTVDALSRFYRPECPATVASLVAILQQASAEVHAWGLMAEEGPGGEERSTDRPLGAAAATVAWFAPGGPLHLLHIGDTAAFIVHNGVARRVTAVHGQGRGLGRYVGQLDVRIDHVEPTFSEGDTLVLLSDGIWNTVGADVVANCVREGRDPQDAAERLVIAAAARGSGDDLTAIVVELEEW